MKITKRQLKRIVKEEKRRMLREQYSSADRARGLYFDVNMTQKLGSVIDGLYHNAMDAARDDGLEDNEAYEMILGAIRDLVEEELMELRY